MKLLVFDTESCTGSRFDGSLCEFGYCLCDEKFNIIKQENILINPQPAAFKLGRFGEAPVLQLAYAEEEYRKKPRFPTEYERIKALFEGDVLAVGLSILNDIHYLNNACEIYGKEKIAYKFLDITLLYMLLKKENIHPGLAAMAAEFGIDFIPHRADSDARASLEVLKGICAALGGGIEEIAAKFGVVFGENSGTVIKEDSCKFLTDMGIGIKRGSRSAKILLSEFLKEVRPSAHAVKGEFSGEKVCFNYGLEYDDTALSRNIIQKLYDTGARYRGSPLDCSLFVYREGLSGCNKISVIKARMAGRGRVKMMEEAEFKKRIGEIPDIKFDDEKILRDYRKAQKKEKYRRMAGKKPSAPPAVE